MTSFLLIYILILWFKNDPMRPLYSCTYTFSTLIGGLHFNYLFPSRTFYVSLENHGDRGIGTWTLKLQLIFLTWFSMKTSGSCSVWQGTTWLGRFCKSILFWFWIIGALKVGPCLGRHCCLFWWGLGLDLGNKFWRVLAACLISCWFWGPVTKSLHLKQKFYEQCLSSSLYLLPSSLMHSTD